MITKIDLKGDWGFRADEEMLGINEHFFSKEPNDTIILPSVTSLAEKGRINENREDGFLTDKYKYEGYAWYYKSVDVSAIPEKSRVELFLERTRITKLWVNGSFVGEFDSLCAPHVYDVTDHIIHGKLDICVMVSNVGYATSGGHMTSQDTQTNWNGITGDISLIISDKTGIRNIQAYPDVKNRSVRLVFELDGIGSADVNVWGVSSDCKTVDNKSYRITSDSPEIVVDLGDDVSLWSEHTPVTYTLKAAIEGSSDISTVTFGMRDFSADGMHFKINGEQVFLRGKHDGMIFPRTIAAPTTVEEWHRVLSIAKSWGINHYRFHTCCPPDAAFTAADMLGIYMQPELPFWGTVHATDDPDFNEKEQEFLIEEGKRILKTFGNHPSFVMMSLGNELWGSTERLNSILGEYKTLDSRHLYTQGSNNFQFYPNIQPNDDFFSGVRLSKHRLIRGSYAACDVPYGFIQTDEPNTTHSYDRLIFPESDSEHDDSSADYIEIQYGTGVKRVKVDSASGGLIPSKPIVTHEVGQYFVYPYYNEIEKYTGSLKARNLEIFRERLAEKGMSSLADDMHEASGMLAYNCYKLEIEAAMRSEYISGFQLLDLQDFTGQGTALVGMLDAFMEEKSFALKNNIRNKWIGFCSEIVILAEIESFVITVGNTVTVPVNIRNMSGSPLKGTRLEWCIGSCKGTIDVPDNLIGLARIGEITFSAEATGRNELVLRIIDGAETCISQNMYEFWAFEPSKDDFDIPAVIERDGITAYITEKLELAEKLLAAGERVIYLPNELKDSIEGFYCADFWNYPMFKTISESMGRQLPVGTLGLLVDTAHPALSGFPTEKWSAPQWYNIVSHAECAVLDDTESDFRPIVQMIDNCERNHKLGLLYEARVGAGKLLVCTSKLSEIKERPEVQAFVKSIIEYVSSERFEPKYETSLETLCLK